VDIVYDSEEVLVYVEPSQKTRIESVSAFGAVIAGGAAGLDYVRDKNGRIRIEIIK